jgi:hypothetical protein
MRNFDDFENCGLDPISRSQKKASGG